MQSHAGDPSTVRRKERSRLPDWRKTDSLCRGGGAESGVCEGASPVSGGDLADIQRIRAGRLRGVNEPRHKDAAATALVSALSTLTAAIPDPEVLREESEAEWIDPAPAPA